MRIRDAVSISAVAILLTACASAGGSEGEPSVRADEGEAIVEVQNLNWSTVHIYVLADGQRYSLGMVTSTGEETFTIPRGAFAGSRDLVFLADPIGAVVAYMSDPVLVEPGDRVQWTIHNNLSQSSISVF